jgi:diguanylate cyclase (GGDEF)-like protein
MASLQGKMLHIRFLNSLQAKVNGDLTPREIVGQAAALIAATFVNDTCLAVARSERDGSEGLPELASLETIHPLAGLESGQRALLCECLAAMGSREDRIPDAWRLTARGGHMAFPPVHGDPSFRPTLGLRHHGPGSNRFQLTPTDDEHILALASRQATLAVELRMTALRLQVAATTRRPHGGLEPQRGHRTRRRGTARAKRYHPGQKGLFSVLFIDLDDFKHWNDECGHQAGDLLLRWLAAVLKDCTRTVDVVGRYGGDEFIVLLPETGAEAALRVSSRIMERLARRDGLAAFAAAEGLPAPVHSSGLAPSCSIGIADAGGDAALGLDALLARADQALYAAKRSGKGRAATA